MSGGGATKRSAAPKKIAKRELVDLDQLDAAARRALGQELFAVHCRIFDGIDEAEFRERVLSLPGRRNVLEVYRDATGAAVGYCALHFYDRRVRGRWITLVWTQGGLLPEYRGQATTFRFGIRQAFLEKLVRPFRPLFVLSSLVHTSSYHFFFKYFPGMYPSPDRPMPPAMRRLILELADGFGVPPVDPADPLVRDDGWITRESDPEAAKARFGALPDVAYYIRRNPGYRRGHGLMVLVPLGVGSLLRAIAARLRETMRDTLHRRPPRP